MTWYRCGVDSKPEYYIYNVGNCAFNTNYKHTADTKVVFKAFIDPFLSNWGQAFGARSYNYATAAFGFFGTYNSNRYCFYRTGQEITGDYITASEDSTSAPWFDTCIFTAYGKSISWYRVSDPNTVKSIEAPNSNANAGIAPLAIYCCNYSTSADGWSPVDLNIRMQLYWFEIYENDVLVHRFIPAYNNDQYCLYDTVDETYIYDTINNGADVRGFVSS